MKKIKFYSLFILGIGFNFIYCATDSYLSPCDIKSKTFKAYFILRTYNKESSSFCNSGTATPTKNSTPIPTPVITPSSKDITSYSIPSLGLTGIINGKQISLASSTLTSFTPAIATFTTTGKSVSIGTVIQTSGVTSNSYSSNLIYKVTAEDGSTQDYTVTLSAPLTYGGSSLRIWLKADSIGLADGAQVAAWNDLSGFGNNFTQATPALRPIFKINQVNNLPSVQFRQATAQILRIVSGGTGLYVTNSGSFFFVFKLIQTSVSGTTILNLHASNGREMALTDPTGQYLQCRNALMCTLTSGIGIPFNQYISIGSVQVLNTTVNEFWNGDLKGSISAAGGNFDYVAGGSPGTAYLSNGNLDADFAEVLYYNTALSQNETDKIFCYLRNKYNLTSVTTSCGN